jgi:NADH:ubiquinone oxidoreductase subunit H
MAYTVWLPPPLAAIHDIFHVSQLKKCIRVPTEIVEQKEILVEPYLLYVEYPIKVSN